MSHQGYLLKGQCYFRDYTTVYRGWDGTVVFFMVQAILHVLHAVENTSSSDPYQVSFLAFYLTYSLTFYQAFYLTNILAFLLASILTSYLTFCLACVRVRAPAVQLADRCEIDQI